MDQDATSSVSLSEVRTAPIVEGSAYPSRAFSIALFLGICAGAWLLFYLIFVSVPLIRPGAEILANAKFDKMATAKLFSAEDRTRILVFGDSTTMAGFRPDVFDSMSGTGVRSYNFGLPGEKHFLPILKAVLAGGNIPTHVLLTNAWDDVEQPPSLLDRLRDDKTIADTVFPFRTLPRDIVTFAAGSRLRFVTRYREAGGEIETMMQQRGWYFIKSQSLYPDHKLPDDYALPTDRPKFQDERKLPERSLVRSELEQLAMHYGFQIVFVPRNVRRGYLATVPVEDTQRIATVARNPSIRVVGPGYWVYPPQDFSDPLHLNPEGAERYTAELARLLAASQVWDHAL